MLNDPSVDSFFVEFQTNLNPPMLKLCAIPNLHRMIVPFEDHEPALPSRDVGLGSQKEMGHPTVHTVETVELV